MGKKQVPGRDRLTLAERSAASGVGVQPARRHCWVADPDAPGLEWPGVLIEWRRNGQGWQARVAWVVEQDHPVLVEMWLSQHRVRPAT